jgi:hypothetical protein
MEQLVATFARRRPSTRAGAVGALALGAMCLIMAGCASAPAPVPPPPEPAPVVPEAVPAAPPPPAYVRVTGSRLNVREAPATTAKVLARTPRGSRLIKLGEDGEWLEVELADGTRGWVHRSYVSAEPVCPADSAEPVILSEPIVGFFEGARHGRVVLDATVSKTGDVVAVEVKENTTGSPEQEAVAVEEMRRLRFAPFIRNCRPVPFVYTYSRSF